MSFVFISSYVKLAFSHCVMTRTEVFDAVAGFQIWWVFANTLNK